MNIDPKFTRPGRGPSARPIVLYAGLLDTATTNGLRSITTKLLHLDPERKLAVAQATVTIESDGVTRLFEGIGDATPENAGQMARDAWIRMAETRAKARALRDAINVGDCSVEGEEEEGWDDVPVSAPPPRPPAPTPLRPSTETTSAPTTVTRAPVTETAGSPVAVVVEDELAQLRHRYAEVVFEAESWGIRPPASAPDNVAGLTRAIASLEGQIARARSTSTGERRTARR